MSGILDEKRMFLALEQCLPEDEKIEAGIHAFRIEYKTEWFFKNCGIDKEKWLIAPFEDENTVQITKGKYSDCAVYLGISENYLVVVDCAKQDHYYKFDTHSPDDCPADDLDRVIVLDDLGKLIPLSDICGCKVKKGMLGSKKCRIDLKNGGYFKFMFPKLGGLGKGMPRHAEFREKIIERLSKFG